MKLWGALAGVIAILATACAVGPEWMLGSHSASEDVIRTFAGHQHCEMQNSTFLVIGWPLGHVEPNMDAARWYVRNPPEFLKPELLADYGSSVTPPINAQYTGYHNSSYELWLASSDQDSVAYIKRDGHFERWPRAKQSLICL